MVKITVDRNTNYTCNQQRMADAFSLLDEAVNAGLIPGAAAGIWLQGELAGLYATGYAVDNGDIRVPCDVDTVYDCASLTKVTVTLPLTLACLEQGLLSLNEPIAELLPVFATAADKSAITVRHLLSHTSGLPGHLPLYEMNLSLTEAVKYIAGVDLVAAPGSQVIYSDLGFILLGQICTELLGLSLSQAAERFVFAPLGMTGSTFNPPPDWKSRMAASEFSRSENKWLHGEVHDENARALGGECGHAGLFSNVKDLLRVANAWLQLGSIEGKRWLSPLTIEAALQAQTRGLNGNRGLGWVLKGDSQDVAGDLFSAKSFGHTGFTGTSLWMDPERQLAVVLLTNRVHYGRGQSITRLRERFHNAMAACLE